MIGIGIQNPPKHKGTVHRNRPDLHHGGTDPNSRSNHIEDPDPRLNHDTVCPESSDPT